MDYKTAAIKMLDEQAEEGRLCISMKLIVDVIDNVYEQGFLDGKKNK